MATTRGNFPVPPTYAEPTIVDPNSGKAQFNPIWLRWFLDVAQFLSGVGLTLTKQINHDSLGGLQGGAPADYFHLTANQLQSLIINPMAGQGDLIVGDATGAATRLSPAAVGTKLTVTAGNVLAWV